MHPKILNGYCDQCPFPSNGENLFLNEGRIDEVKENLLQSDFNTFSCHKTIGGDTSDHRMCYGAARFLEMKKRPSVYMRVHNWKSEERKLEEFTELDNLMSSILEAHPLISSTTDSEAIDIIMELIVLNASIFDPESLSLSGRVKSVAKLILMSHGENEAIAKLSRSVMIREEKKIEKYINN